MFVRYKPTSILTFVEFEFTTFISFLVRLQCSMLNRFKNSTMNKYIHCVAQTIPTNVKIYFAKSEMYLFIVSRIWWLFFVCIYLQFTTKLFNARQPFQEIHQRSGNISCYHLSGKAQPAVRTIKITLPIAYTFDEISTTVSTTKLVFAYICIYLLFTLKIVFKGS